jgi:hypothetical protein
MLERARTAHGLRASAPSAAIEKAHVGSRGREALPKLEAAEKRTKHGLRTSGRMYENRMEKK